MASVRPIPKSYYYSGQGRLGVGDRNPDGSYENLIFVGNVTSLALDIATTKFDHKESMSGQRAIDVSFVQEKTATFTFNAESLILELLALGLYGEQKVKAGGTVASEQHRIRATADGYAAIPLKNPNVASVVIGALVEGTDYLVDEGFGTVYPIAGSAAVAALVDQLVSVNYTHGQFNQIDAFTQSTAPERYLRFEGLNTVDGSLRLIEIPRAAFDPLTGLEFINEELGAGEFNGNILPDLTITAAGESQYFRERRVAGPGLSQPTVAAAVIANADPDALVVTFSEPLVGTAPAGAGGFTVSASAGGAVTVTAVALSGANATLALSRAIANGQVITLSYTPPGSNPLSGTTGAVASFTGRSVTNNVSA